MLRRSQGSEWFRRPPPPSNSFSTPSQGSAIDDTEEAIGQVHEEGEAYLSAACVMNNQGFDILEWWQANETTFPQLSQVAKDVLSVPIAQVGVERVFNVAKDVIGDRRHRLATRTIRQIMVLKDTIPQEMERSVQTQVGVEDEEPPCDEVNDILELPVPRDLLQEPMEYLFNIDEDIMEIPTPAPLQQPMETATPARPLSLVDEDSPSRPSRKRVKPARYCT